VIAHWDEAESGRGEAGHIAGEWTDPGGAGTCLLRDSAFEAGPGDCIVLGMHELHTRVKEKGG
jgi:hypothetical protein